MRLGSARAVLRTGRWIDTSPLPGYRRETFRFTGVNVFICRGLACFRALPMSENHVSEIQKFTPVNTLIGSGLADGHSDRNDI
jgi:hypothetical protein